MHDRGFVTMMATDDCGNDLAAFIGKRPKVDHKIGTFWCASEIYYNFHNNAQKQRCIGPKNAHTYMLDYLLEFSENYKEVSRFSYIHINTAHEGSGTVISTLDSDLVNFLTDITRRQERTVIFLMGDHGMRYGNWFTHIDGSHEHRLPLLMTIASDSVLNLIDNSRDYLFHNSNRLISKFDLHTTLTHLSNLNTKEDLYSELICNTSLISRSYSLLKEAIPNERTCEEIQIPSF